MGAGGNAKNYDGTNDYATRGSDLTGNADGKEGTLSFWIKLNGGNSSNLFILTNTGGFLNVLRHSSNIFRVRGENSSGTEILLLDSSTTYTSGGGWVHVIAAWNLATPEAYLYINDSDDENTGASTETDDTIDYTRTDYAIGATVAGTAKLNGCLSELWFDHVFYDISTTSVRRNWIDASGNPVELGSTGANPGAQPLIYAPNGDPSTNAGSGGNFSITGSLTDCADAPGSSGTTVAVGLATETDTAFAITDSQTASIGLASEADSAFPVGYDVILIPGQAIETDSAFPVTINVGVNVGLASETDTAFPMTDLQVVVMGQAVETDSAFAVTVSTADVIQVGQAIETDTAFSITDSQTVQLGLAQETDTAWPLTPVLRAARIFYITRDPSERKAPTGFRGELFNTEDHL